MLNTAQLEVEIAQNGNSWWPQDYSEFSVGTLALKSSSPTTWSTLKLTGDGPWIGIWGFFIGLRISNSQRLNSDTGNALSFPVGSGSILPYPSKPGAQATDLFFVQEISAAGTGIGAGNACVARFRTYAQAKAWCDLQASGVSQAPPGAGASFADAKSLPTALTLQQVGAYGLIFNDVAAKVDRMRQPNAESKFITDAVAVSVASTGIKLTYTATQDGRVVSGTLEVTTVLNTVADVQVNLQRVSGANTFNIAQARVSNTNGSVTGGVWGFVMNDGGTGAIVGTTTNTEGFLLCPPFDYLAGDVIQMNVTVAAGTSGNMSFHLSVEEDRFDFED